MEKAIVLTTVLLVSFYPYETEQFEDNRFGTKTAYQFNSSVVNSSPMTPKNCYPVHLNMFGRGSERNSWKSCGATSGRNLKPRGQQVNQATCVSEEVPFALLTTMRKGPVKITLLQ